MKKIDIGGIWKAIPDNPCTTGIDSKWYEKGLPDKNIIPRIHSHQNNYMVLPGTTDDAHIGIKFSPSDTLSHGLERAYRWEKDIWLEKEIYISKIDIGKQNILKFERTCFYSALWINGVFVGEDISAATPHLYDITDFVFAGKNRITIRLCAKLSDEFTRRYFSHHFASGSVAGNTTEGYGCFHGIIGGIEMQISENILPKKMKCYANLNENTVVIKANVDTELTYTAIIEIFDDEKIIYSSTIENSGNISHNAVLAHYQAWNEINPKLYTCRITIICGGLEEQDEVIFGMQSYSVIDTQIAINGDKIFLRGTHEGCQFPYDSAPPMDITTWEKAMKVAKQYGMNHFRFHSWCPPKAAFIVADNLGLYLQVELGRGDKKELLRVLDTYGNHPSFMGLTFGNELFNHNEDTATEKHLSQRLVNNDVFEETSSKCLTEWARNYDSRHLYSCTSHPVSQDDCADDYYVSAWGRNKKPTVGIEWGGGDVQTTTRFNTKPPETKTDYSHAIEGINEPLISHEVGQWAVYPNLMEWGKYTGTLANHNYHIIKEQLRENYLLDKAHLFTKASGKLSVELYKEEIESALRTKGFGGFALLDLHDYPGQGIATIGTLDAFWDSKGLIEPEEYSEFCNLGVPLLRLEKRVFTFGEELIANLDFSNFTFGDLSTENAIVELIDVRTNSVIESQKLPAIVLPKQELSFIATVKFDLSKIKKCAELCIKVSINEAYKNKWKIWVFDSPKDTILGETIVHKTVYDDEAECALKDGKTVLLCPKFDDFSDARSGCFTTEFWTPHNKPLPPAKTQGLYIDDTHPMFKDFPTSFHTDWQWWELIMNSFAIVLNNATYNLSPIVGVIDNFDTNERLCSLVECKVGNGKLVVCTFDLNNFTSPVVAQFKRCLYQYIASTEFKPKSEMTFEMVHNIFTKYHH